MHLGPTFFPTAESMRTRDLAREAGIDRVLFPLPSVGRDSALPLLDRLAGLAGR